VCSPGFSTFDAARSSVRARISAKWQPPNRAPPSSRNCPGAASPRCRGKVVPFVMNDQRMIGIGHTRASRAGASTPSSRSNSRRGSAATSGGAAKRWPAAPHALQMRENPACRRIAAQPIQLVMVAKILRPDHLHRISAQKRDIRPARFVWHGRLRPRSLRPASRHRRVDIVKGVAGGGPARFPSPTLDISSEVAAPDRAHFLRRRRESASHPRRTESFCRRGVSWLSSSSVRRCGSSPR